MDWENIDRITNSYLSLVIADGFVDLTLTRFLVDDGSYYNVLYEDA